MKKLFTFLLLLSGIILAGTAQTRYTSAVLTDPASGYSSGVTPVKKWKNIYSVSYQRDASKPFFCLIDNSALLSSPSLPVPPPVCPVYHSFVPINAPYTDLDVNDIYTLGNYAFFCGSVADTHIHVRYAIWGYFNIMDFFTSSMNIEFNVLLDDTEIAPTILDRIVAYPSGTSYTVVTYGRDMVSGNWKMVEIQNALGIPSGCDVISLHHQTPPGAGAVYIDDMTLTGNYVVFTGHDNYATTNTLVWYGRYMKNYFSSGRIYWLTSYSEPNGHVICTALNPGEDLFALDYTHYDEPNRKWFNRLRVIDPGSASNLYSQQFIIDTKREPLRMTYLPDLSSVELIQENSLLSHFILMQPFSTLPYSASRLTPPGELYYNLDNITGRHFIAACGSIFYFQDRTMSVPASTPSCPGNGEVEVEEIDNLNSWLAYLFSPGNLANLRVPLTGIVLPDTLKVDCYSFERDL